MITELNLVGFRCFPKSEIHFSDSVNLILGDNGSGKSSLIEAIYLLGRGKSFRTTHNSDLINSESCQAIATLKGSTSSHESFFLGCSIEKSKLFFKLNSSSVRKRSTLLDIQPLQLFTPTAHQLIDSGPVFRRRFLDWGLFHVEQYYRSKFDIFTKILKQRNHALKNLSPDLSQWTDEFVNISCEIDQYRQDYSQKLYKYFSSVQKDLGQNFISELMYSSGWAPNKDLKLTLLDSYKREIKQGFTQYGPQKADLKFSFPDSVRNNLSRGQQKITVFALQMAQCLLLRDLLGIETLLLMDDLSSELDKSNLNLLIDYIASQKFQAVVSLIDDHNVSTQKNISRFHVEQLKITQG